MIQSLLAATKAGRNHHGLTGYEIFTSNFGEISNTGVEILLGGSPVIGSFNWNTTLTWSYNRNVIEDLGLDAEGNPLQVTLPPQTAFQNNMVSMFVLGESIGTFWGQNWLGLHWNALRRQARCHSRSNSE